MPDFETECFFIAPIGKSGSPERERSDGVRDYIVKPAVEPLGLTPLRADQIGQPGQINHQVIEHVLRARGAIADLTGANANVYYELAVRHAARLPVILIADDQERARLPFDLSQMRTVFFDHTNLASAARARDEITLQLRQALDGAVDSPVSTAVNLQALEGGSRVEQTLAELIARVDQLGTSVTQSAAYIGSLMQPRPFTGNLGVGLGRFGSGIASGNPYFVGNTGSVPSGTVFPQSWVVWDEAQTQTFPAVETTEGEAPLAEDQPPAGERPPAKEQPPLEEQPRSDAPEPDGESEPSDDSPA